MRIFFPFIRRFVRPGILGFLILLLTSCGGIGSNTTLTHSGTAAPSVGKFTEFALPATARALSDITKGPDSNLWFTDIMQGKFGPVGKIGRMTPTGTISEFRGPSSTLRSTSNPTGITVGPDGNLWFTDAGINMIGYITSGK